jgi:methionyl aminopeptidase
MNLFADLLASTSAGRGGTGLLTQSGPRIQKSRRGVEIKSAREIAIMRQASRIVATVLREIMEMAAPGMTTGDLDRHGRAAHPRDGRHPELQGLPRVPRQHLRQHQQRGGAWHPQRQTGDQGW